MSLFHLHHTCREGGNSFTWWVTKSLRDPSTSSRIFLLALYLPLTLDLGSLQCVMNTRVIVRSWTKFQQQHLGHDLQSLSSCLCWVNVRPIGLLYTSLVDQTSAFNAGLIPGSGRSLGEGNGSSLQYFCLENSMHRGAWRATVHGFAKSQTQLSEWHVGL